MWGLIVQHVGFNCATFNCATFNCASLYSLVCFCLEASKCEVKKEPAKVESVAVGGKLTAANVPPCNVGCAESLLGFLNCLQETGVEDLLKVNYIN